MNRQARLRRVFLLCLHCTRNLAYYRAAWHERTLHPDNSQFWLTVNSNFLNECVLEWCKLFGKKDHHCWRNVVSEPLKFEAALLKHLSLEQSQFEGFIGQVHHYRDKFVAHLDSDMEMDIPRLDIIKSSTAFYQTHVVNEEAEFGDLWGFVESYLDPNMYFDLCENEARQVYERFRERHGS